MIQELQRSDHPNNDPRLESLEPAKDTSQYHVPITPSRMYIVQLSAEKGNFRNMWDFEGKKRLITEIMASSKIKISRAEWLV